MTFLSNHNLHRIALKRVFKSIPPDLFSLLTLKGIITQFIRLLNPLSLLLAVAVITPRQQLPLFLPTKRGALAA